MTRRLLLAVPLITLLFSGAAFADPILGTWKLNVEKSKFISGAELAHAVRTYSKSNGIYTLKQTLTRADGKEVSVDIRYRDGRAEKQTSPFVDTNLAKKVNANTWDFELLKGGKVVGHPHRVVSADGKTLTLIETGTQASGRTGDETLVFDKQ